MLRRFNPQSMLFYFFYHHGDFCLLRLDIRFLSCVTHRDGIQLCSKQKGSNSSSSFVAKTWSDWILLVKNVGILFGDFATSPSFSNWLLKQVFQYRAAVEFLKLLSLPSLPNPETAIWKILPPVEQRHSGLNRHGWLCSPKAKLARWTRKNQLSQLVLFQSKPVFILGADIRLGGTSDSLKPERVQQRSLL